MLLKHQLLVLLGCAVSMCLFIASTTGNVWVKHTVIENSPSNQIDYNSKLDYYGIWMYCFQNGDCREIGADAWEVTKWLYTPNWLQAVRIFACMSAVLEAFGIIKTIIGIFKNKVDLKESKYALMAGPFLMLIAMAIYTGFEGPYPRKDFTWGWSFIVGWVATILTPIYGLTVIKLTWTREEDEYQIEAPMVCPDLEIH